MSRDSRCPCIRQNLLLFSQNVCLVLEELESAPSCIMFARRLRIKGDYANSAIIHFVTRNLKERKHEELLMERKLQLIAK